MKHIGFILLFLLLTGNALARTMNSQFNRKIWVKNAIDRSINSSDNEGYAYPYYAKEYVRKYNDFRVSNPDWQGQKINKKTLEYMYEVKKTVQHLYNFNADKISDTIPEVLNSAAHIIGVVKTDIRSKTVSVAITEATKWGVRGINYVFGDNMQANAMNDGAMKYRKSFLAKERNFGDLWDLAETSPDSKQGIDAFFADRLKASITQNGLDILNQNFGLKLDDKLGSIQEVLNGNATKENINAIKKLTKNSLDTLGDNVKKSTKILSKKLDAQNTTGDVKLILYNTKELRTHNSSKLDERQLELKQEYEYRAIESAIFASTSLINVVGRTTKDQNLIKLAHSSQVVASAYLTVQKTIDSFDKIAKISGEGVAMTLATGNYIGAALAIVGLFMSSGPSADEMILEQIQKLRQDIADFRNEMNERFDQLSEQVTSVYNSIDETLAYISRDIHRNRDIIKKHQRELLTQVYALEKGINSIEHLLIKGQVEEVLLQKNKSMEEVAAGTNLCLRMSQHIEEDRFFICLFKLNSHLNTRFQEINFLTSQQRNMLLSYADEGLLLTSLSATYANTLLPDVDLWQQNVQSYFRFANNLAKNTNFKKDLAGDISALTNHGFEIQSTYQTLYETRKININKILSDIGDQASLRPIYIKSLIQDIQASLKGDYLYFESDHGTFDLLDKSYINSSFVPELPIKFNHCTKGHYPAIKAPEKSVYEVLVPSDLRVFMGLNRLKIEGCYTYIHNPHKNEMTYQLVYHFRTKNVRYDLGELLIRRNKNKKTELGINDRFLLEWNESIEKINATFKKLKAKQFKFKEEKSYQIHSSRVKWRAKGHTKHKLQIKQAIEKTRNKYITGISQNFKEMICYDKELPSIPSSMKTRLAKLDADINGNKQLLASYLRAIGGNLKVHFPSETTQEHISQYCKSNKKFALLSLLRDISKNKKNYNFDDLLIAVEKLQYSPPHWLKTNLFLLETVIQ